MVKMSILFRFPLGTFNDLSRLELEVSQPKGACNR